MKVHDYYLALFLTWLYLDLMFPLEKWFDVAYFSGHDGVFMEIKSKKKEKKEETVQSLSKASVEDL